MSKVIVAYTVAGLSLFGALFAALALSGLMRPGPTMKEIALAEAAAAPPPPSPTVYIPPTLDSGRVYRMSHETPIYPAPAQDEAERRMLAAGGYFRVLQTLETPSGPWLEISVDDGVNESTMYLYGLDLRWKTLTPQYSADETQKMEVETALQTLIEMARRNRPNRIVEAAPEPEPEPQTFERWWAETAQRLGGAASANLIVSAGAAGLATILILGSIALLAILRREHAWSSPATYSDFDAGSIEEDPYAYAQSAQDDSDAGDGGDQPRG